jgi:oxygen-independent coproporphyrinogen-3 oxidase
MGLRELIGKYSISGPRYTSYPTAPHWVESLSESDRQKKTGELNKKDSFAIYTHLPFCESLCYYCGCNIQITHDKSRSESYIQVLLEEFKQFSRQLAFRPNVNQVSWGGGTPTFLSVSELERLYIGLSEYFSIDKEAEVSLEIDPRVTSFLQLEALRRLGFNRVSMGVQDFDSTVQKAVNRIQSPESTKEMLLFCRSLGFTGISFDLIYGLPFQTKNSFEKTIDQVVEMKPDRIALFNYARLPSMIPHQKILEKHPMPDSFDRLDIFLLANERLRESGYMPIGMDHFA